LEAIVALTILASSGMALFAWVNQSMQTASRLKVKEQQAHMKLSALALLETVNPATRPTGSMDQAGLRLEWSARLVEPERPNATFSPPDTGPWVVGLYRLQVKVRDPVQAIDLEFGQLKAGARRPDAPSGTP